MVRRLTQSLFIAARRSIHELAIHRPGLGLHLAGRLGAAAVVRSNSWRAPTAEALTAILGPLPASQVLRIRSSMASLQSRNEAIAHILQQRGLESILPLVTTVCAEPLLRLRERGVPIIAVAWHQGPFRAMSLAFRKIRVPALFGMVNVIREPDSEGEVVRYASLADRPAEVRFLRRAQQALSEGVVVGLQLDCAWVGERVPFLGRQVLFGRGAAALARRTGARLVPVTRRFLGASGQMEVTFHEPIDDADLDPASGAAFERELLIRAAERLASEARKDPGSWRPSRVHWLRSAPCGGSTQPDTNAPTSAWTAWRRRRRRARNRKQWEKNWGSPEFDPYWLRRDISAEIRAAVASGWFPPGSIALDAGCGEGDVAAWLAERGYPTVGADIAESAIARAHRSHGERPGSLRFVRADLCEGAPPGGPFQVVVDRGCFLQLEERERGSYATHLAAACIDDARLLVFGRAFRDGVAFGDADEINRRRTEVLLAFGPYFEIENVAPTYLDRHHGERPNQSLPGIVFWLRRRPS